MSGHSDRAHSLLSPSRLPRVMRCVGSVALEEQYENSENRYSAEGTAGHEVAADCLTLGIDTREFVGRVIKVGSYEIEIEADYADDLQKYVDYVRGCLERGAILFKLEQRVDFSEDIGIEDQTGSSDCILIWPELRTVEAIDLKCGYTPVDAEGNEQGRGYNLGALREVEPFYDIDFVTTTICQIRASFTSETISVAELREWAQTELRPAAAQAKWLYDELQGHRMTVKDIDANGFLVPGPKQCQFCRAAERAGCPALDREAITDVAQAASPSDFEDLTKHDNLPAVIEARQPLISELSNDALAQRFAAATLVETWLSGIRAETERRMLAGETLPDPDGGELKLIRGRKGNRKFTNADEAEKIMKGARLKADEMYTKKLISAPAAEKVLKEKPKVWAKLSGLIDQSEGKLSVARAAAKGDPVSPVAKPADFEALPPEEDLSSLA